MRTNLEKYTDILAERGHAGVNKEFLNIIDETLDTLTRKALGPVERAARGEDSNQTEEEFIALMLLTIASINDEVFSQLFNTPNKVLLYENALRYIEGEDVDADTEKDLDVLSDLIDEVINKIAKAIAKETKKEDK